VAGAGDELQGIKKGVVELADAILVNKADGANAVAAEAARGEYERALHYLQPATPGWQSRAVCASALTGQGVPDVWRMIGEFCAVARSSGAFVRRRQEQERDWLHALIEQQLVERFRANPQVARLLPELEVAVMEGRLPVTSAAQRLLDLLS